MMIISAPKFPHIVDIQSQIQAAVASKSIKTLEKLNFLKQAPIAIANKDATLSTIPIAAASAIISFLVVAVCKVAIVTEREPMGIMGRNDAKQ